MGCVLLRLLLSILYKAVFLWCCHPLKGNNLGEQVLQKELSKSRGYCGLLRSPVSLAICVCFVFFSIVYRNILWIAIGFLPPLRCPWKGSKCQWNLLGHQSLRKPDHGKRLSFLENIPPADQQGALPTSTSLRINISLAFEAYLCSLIPFQKVLRNLQLPLSCPQISNSLQEASSKRGWRWLPLWYCCHFVTTLPHIIVIFSIYSVLWDVKIATWARLCFSPYNNPVRLS